MAKKPIPDPLVRICVTCDEEFEATGTKRTRKNLACSPECREIRRQKVGLVYRDQRRDHYRTAARERYAAEGDRSGSDHGRHLVRTRDKDRRDAPTHCPRCGRPEEFDAAGRSLLQKHHPPPYREGVYEYLCHVCHAKA